jgi:hypothetical protein
MAWVRALGMSGIVGLAFASGCTCSATDSVFDDGSSVGGAGAAMPAGGEGGVFVGPVGPGQGGAQVGGGDIGGAGGGDEDCVHIPQPGQFNPQEDCRWETTAPGDPYPAFRDVVSTPVVVNLTDDDMDNDVDLDDIPDIAFIAYVLSGSCPAGATCGCCNSSGVLRVVSGACNLDKTMTQHFVIGRDEIAADPKGAPNIWLDNSGGLAAGDIDADGSVDIVATILNGGTIAFERNGAVKWIQPNHPTGAEHYAGTTPAIADLNGDGQPEVIQGRVVLSGVDGSLLFAPMTGSVGNNGFMGPVTALGDIDRDGNLNIISGNTVYNHQGQEMWTYNFPVASNSAECQGHSQGRPCNGYAAIGNFDADDDGEVVLVRMGKVYVIDTDGTILQHNGMDVIIPIPKSNCPKNEGGPPTVADFDGDGMAEIGAAGANFYIVADLECMANPVPPQCSDFGIRWKVANQDCSSRVTGSSVFDFDGDGQAEVVYNDEKRFRMLKGSDGTVLVDLPNGSHTRLEMPIVADVDNDGNAEVVFVENAFGSQNRGIRIWGDATDSWVPTRRIWNQHAYHVTNVTELGMIPKSEPINWLEPSFATVSGVMNNFRQNLPEFDVTFAPDLTVDLSFDKSSCPGSMGLVAKVCNEGAVVVGANTVVRFYDNMTKLEIACSNAPVLTNLPLPPGKCQSVICYWSNPPEEPAMVDVRACVDNGGYECDQDVLGGNNECHEDNNLSDKQELGCPGIN